MPDAVFSVQGADSGGNFTRPVAARDHMAAVAALMDWIEERDKDGGLTAVGHRIVHGGPNYREPQRVTAELVEELRRLIPLDPEHLPQEILLTEAFHRRFPQLPQIACFDTAFHHDLPRVARLLPIPRRYEAQGVRRYGFHGLSYEFLMGELIRTEGAVAARGRIILAHLGNGASLAAVRDGKPVDTSMGFTPAAGVPMSTRSGDLDPGLAWYLARTEQLDARQFNELFTQFSFPGGIPSHASPECPGSIHEGGELGYSLSHAFGAVFDNPDFIVACVVGDGEAETGPLATAWHSNKFLDPVTDGAVLPILHLNGYKISNPALLARISREELEQLLRGYGWTPYFVEGYEPGLMHEAMAAALDTAVEQIKEIQQDARVHGNVARPRWPMIVLDSPKGWTGPKMVDGLQVEGTFRSHQVPLSDPATHPEHLKLLEDWLRSYRPEELFDGEGRLKPELAELAPKGERRMGANPHANGGILLRDLRMPDFRDYAVDVSSPGVRGSGDTHVLGRFLRDVAKLNEEQRNFRVFGPDETLSNGLEALFEVTQRQWDAATKPSDEFLAPTGRVMEMLSEHQCEGWLEGYLLTGRHGLFNCYEAFIHIVDSMFNQHAKWLKVTAHLPWRRKIASLNYLLASHVWRQDHNGFTHQDPGFIDHVVNKKAEVVRVYLPPDANCLLSVMDHCLKSRHYVNVVIAGKHPAPQWLTMDAAVKHCTAGIGIWPWASNDEGAAPDVVMACCGDVPTLETLAAVSIMREHLPELKIRVVNIVNLMKLQPQTEHPHGLSDRDFDAIFTQDKPVIFAFHAYPWLIHWLTYRRTNHDNIHVRGYKEEGTITTAFDMTVLNDLDRFHLVMDTIDRLPQTGDKGICLKQQLKDKLIEHKQYIAKHGQDLPEIRDWKWGATDAGRICGSAAPT